MIQRRFGAECEPAGCPVNLRSTAVTSHPPFAALSTRPRSQPRFLVQNVGPRTRRVNEDLPGVFVRTTE
jgi:hypothetical protein